LTARALCEELCGQRDNLLTDLPMTETREVGFAVSGDEPVLSADGLLPYRRIGLNGAEAGRENSAVGAFWARPGAGDTVMLTGREPVFRAVGMGAHQIALSAHR
jgi:hypothetical protein